ncbi:MAG: polysaccharide biosynthesis/export family protein [Candidatus Brocadiia bacterium]
MTGKAHVWVIGVLGLALCGCYPRLEYADLEKEWTRHELRQLEKRFERLNGTYEIGVPDTINVNVPDHPDLSGTFEVRPDGNISYPLLGDVYVEGLTPMGVSKMLADRLEAYVQKPEVQVTVTGFYSKQVYVFSRVRQGGTRFPFTGDMSVLDLIAMNGGFSRLARADKLRLIRDDPEGAQVFRIYAGRMMRGDLTTNIMVKENDTLYIPAHWWAEVAFAAETFSYPFRALVTGLYHIGAAPYEVTRGAQEWERRREDIDDR